MRLQLHATGPQSESGNDNEFSETTETVTDKTLPPKDNDILKQGAKYALDMVLYSAKVGKEIPEGTITAISDFSEKLESKSYSTADQVQFINALTSLSVLYCSGND